jgi:hypothetical protein
MDDRQFELATELLRFVVPPGAAEAFLAAVQRPSATAAAADPAEAQLEAVTLQPRTPQKQDRQPKGTGVSQHSSPGPALGVRL